MSTPRFTEEEHRRVTQAVAAAEAKTAAEIVPVIAGASGRYDRAEDVAGLWLGALLMILAWWLYPLPVVESGDWGGSPAVLQLVCMLLALLAGFIIGAMVTDNIPPLRRLFTPQQQMKDEVNAKARVAFFDKRVHHTTGANGLLIYISLYEHLAVVLADQSTLDKLGAATVESLCADLTGRLRQGHNVIDALAATIAVAGDKLATVLPRQGGDVNELSDALVVM